MISQNNTTKKATTIVAAMLIGLMLSSMTVLPNVSAMSNILTHECEVKAQKTEFSLAKQLDEGKARSMVTSAGDFNGRTAGYTLQYGGVFNIWKIDDQTCSPTWQSVNVVYFLDDAQGKYQKNLVYTLDPQLTKITAVSEFKSHIASTTLYNTQYAGYEFAADSTHSTLVTSTYMTFSVPTVTPPSGFTCSASSTTPDCPVDVWNGLMDNYSPHASYLVQAGGSSDVVCDSTGNNCNEYYSTWYEAVGSGSAEQPCFTVLPTDALSSTITQESGNANNYDIAVDDVSSSTSCTKTITGYGMSKPVVSPFVDERPTYNPTQTLGPLPVWSSNQLNGDITYNSVSNSIWTPYSNGNYQWDRMTSDGTQNTHELITESTVGSSGSFTDTYHYST